MRHVKYTWSHDATSCTDIVNQFENRGGSQFFCIVFVYATQLLRHLSTDFDASFLLETGYLISGPDKNLKKKISQS